MKSVGVREFRDHAAAYLSGADPIAVRKHGRIIGFYLPLTRDDDEVSDALAKLGSTVERVLAASGMSEDQLADLFDLRKPVE
jgi:hypothetical protein